MVISDIQSEQILSLDDVLEANEQVILDTSLAGSNNFIWDIYDKNYYHELDAYPIQGEIRHTEIFLKLIKDPRTMTIPAVTGELWKFVKIIGDKNAFLSRNNPVVKSCKSNLKRYRKVNEKTHENKEALETLQKLAFSCYSASRGKELEITNPLYERMVANITGLDKLIILKRDYSAKYNKIPKNPVPSSDTDERITAALYWLSMFSNNHSSALLTHDMDFTRLIPICARILGSDEFFPHNKRFREALQAKPIRTYIPTLVNPNGAYNLALSSNAIVYDSEFKLTGVDENQANEFGAIVYDFWEDFEKICSDSE